MREGVLLYKQGKYQDALESFLKADLAQDEYPLFSYNLGLCYTRLGKYEEALLYLEQVVTSDITSAQLYQSRMLLGYIYSETRRYRLASFEFKKLLEEGYESTKVYTALAHVLFLDRKVEESLDYLGKALKLEPENVSALNSLGYVLAETGSRLTMAFGYCSKAVKAYPNSPAYLDSLGWVLFKMGKHKDAIEVLRKALLLAPGQPVIKDHLQKALNDHKKQS